MWSEWVPGAQSHFIHNSPLYSWLGGVRWKQLPPDGCKGPESPN